MHLEVPQLAGRQAIEPATRFTDRQQGTFLMDDFLHLGQKPRVDRAFFEDFFDTHADPERVTDMQDPVGCGFTKGLCDFVSISEPLIKTVDTNLQSPQCFLE